NDFEKTGYAWEVQNFGPPSDINLDGRVTLLFTPVVNSLGGGTGSMVTGFFSPCDLFKSGSGCVSNEQEMLYLMVPDPAGQYGGTPVSSTFTIDSILKGVMPHELQHMISFNQHVFKHHGPSEASWLNECLSHFVEGRTGYGDENYSRDNIFLSQSSRISIVPPTSPNIAERGGCHLFLSYLYEQYGHENKGRADDFLKKLLDTEKTGVENLETAYQGQDADFDTFPEFMNRWAITLAISELGVTSDPRYNYEARFNHPETGHLSGVCVHCEAHDSRNTVLDGPSMTTFNGSLGTLNMKSATVQYFHIKNPSHPLHLVGVDDKSLTASLVRMTPK
ncbi:MAG: hypothetical protein HY073_04355, partial [Deltaproteobacteria bacterium]|nr:hypothetical protein [Deltaproteobacteria bacterium]